MPNSSTTFCKSLRIGEFNGQGMSMLLKQAICHHAIFVLAIAMFGFQVRESHLQKLVVLLFSLVRS
jgi:hypothetical protein